MEEWIRSLKDNPGEKFSLRNKKIRYLVVVIVCIGLLSLLWPGGNPKTGENSGRTGPIQAGSIKEQMQAELETILSQVDGAGRVEVEMTLVSDGIRNYATNIKDETRQTEEKDTQGVERTVREQNTSKDVAVFGGDSLLIEQKSPQIVGVLVVADGARNPLIKEELTNVTTTLLNLSAHQVRVVARRTDAKRG